MLLKVDKNILTLDATPGLGLNLIWSKAGMYNNPKAVDCLLFMPAEGHNQGRALSLATS